MSDLPEPLITGLIVLAGAIITLLGVWLMLRAQKKDEAADQAMAARLEELERRLAEQLRGARDSYEESLRGVSRDLSATINAFTEKQTAADAQARTDLHTALKGLSDGQTEGRERQLESLQKLQESNAKRLDDMRETQQAATEKLTETMRAQLETMNKTMGEGLAEAREKQTQTLTTMQEGISARLDAANKAMTEGLTQAREKQMRSIGELQETNAKKLEELRTSQQQAFEKLQEGVAAQLEAIRKDNEDRLEKIRLTVDEKLQSTLEKRLGESFTMVSRQLESVHQGLGEMQKLAGGVDQLQRVLTNVKARGTFGETQLGALLDQALAQSQYEANCVTVPGSNARVEFAIKLPGQDQGGTVLLPIDAKFPNEDYLRLQEAAERCDVEAVARERKNLAVRLEAMAKDIREKYVSAPHTTDFAMMFLPTEGLYAEALRLDGLTERIQSQHNVVVVGPTTLLAVLNSFQMGFRTLAIQKRSGEVWQVLGAVKEEFAKFGDSLEAVRKKLQEAQNKIEFSQRRSRVMNRKLKQVESFDGEEGAAALLGLDEEDEEDAEVEVPAE